MTIEKCLVSLATKSFIFQRRKRDFQRRIKHRMNVKHRDTNKCKTIDKTNSHGIKNLQFYYIITKELSFKLIDFARHMHRIVVVSFVF